MGILDLILQHQPHDQTSVDLALFCVIAALSERIMELDPLVADCLNKMDFAALRTKLQKARDLFLFNDVNQNVRLYVLSFRPS